MNQKIIGFSIIIIFGLSLSFMTAISLPTVIKQPLANLNLEFDENNFILTPNQAYPTLCQAGDNIKVIYQTNISEDPNQILLSNEFVYYSIEVIQISEIAPNGERSLIISTSSNFLPLIYSLIINFSNGIQISSYNAVKITNKDLSTLDSYSFVHFTDTHINGQQNRYDKVLRLISEINLLNPDFCLLTGDIVDGLTGITDDNGNPITAEIQYPQAVALLKELNVPVFVVSGNHDFQTNSWQNGNELWFRYFGKVGTVMNFSYSQDQYIGVSLIDENGLTDNQIQEIELAYANSSSGSSINVFFAHHDYKNQFPKIYQDNMVNLALLGHQHITIERNVSDTIEVALDNSISFTETEPGHYRIYKINSDKEITYKELEVDQLTSNISFDSINESSIRIHMEIRNFHLHSFSNSRMEILLPGNWSNSQITKSPSINLFSNGSHTLIYFLMDIEARTDYNSEIILSLDSDLYSWVTNSSVIKIPSSTTDSSNQTSKQNNGANFITFQSIIFTLLGYIFILKYNRRNRS